MIQKGFVAVSVIAPQAVTPLTLSHDSQSLITIPVITPISCTCGTLLSASISNSMTLHPSGVSLE